MRTYKRGNVFSPEIQAQFQYKSDLKKYWLCDSEGNPTGNPFLRRSDVELFQSLKPEENYQILSNPVGKPPSEIPASEKAIAYERKRSQDPKRKAYKAELARKRYKAKKLRTNCS